MREIKLKNGINVCIKTNSDTPRIALSMNFSIVNPEKYAGQYLLMNRLLLKGTQRYSSEELSTILDENAIELYTEMKYDYLRFRFVALNEDFELALSILADIVCNSTFEEFEKEKAKLKGEIVAELDSAKVRVSQLFTENIYRDHFYGHCYNMILDQIDNVTLEDVKNSYYEILNNSRKTAVIVGDIEAEKVKAILDNTFEAIPEPKDIESNIVAPSKLDVHTYVEYIKEDAQQAQILQGWLVPAIGHEDYP